MYSQKTLKDSPSATSSRESEDGQQQLDLLAGMMSDPCGQEAHPASHSVQPGTEKDKTMSDTCGLSSSISSASARLQSSLESRLRQPLERAGSTIYKMTWKQKATPAQWPYCQLAASVPRTKGIDSSMSQKRVADAQCDLSRDIARDNEEAKRIQKAQCQSEHGSDVPDRCGPGDAQQGICTGDGLQGRRKSSMADADSPQREGKWLSRGVDKKHTSAGSGSASNSGLANTNDSGQPGTEGSFDDPATQRRMKIGKSIELSRLIHSVTSGQEANTYTAETGKSVKYQLNPRFSLWLMGYPIEWAHCAERVTPSSHRSRQKS